MITVPTARDAERRLLRAVRRHPRPAGRRAAPFPNNQIPANRLDPIALKYLALYPAPTSAGLANNYASITERTQDSSTADVRIDHRFNDSMSMFGRYSYNNVDTFTPSACPPTADGIEPGCGGGLAFPGPNITKAHGVQGNFVRVHSDSLISEFKVGYLKADIQSLPLNYGTEHEPAVRHPGRECR